MARTKFDDGRRSEQRTLTVAIGIKKKIFLYPRTQEVRRLCSDR
jgi:hypothetical protein